MSDKPSPLDRLLNAFARAVLGSSAQYIPLAEIHDRRSGIHEEVARLRAWERERAAAHVLALERSEEGYVCRAAVDIAMDLRALPVSDPPADWKPPTGDPP